MSPASETHPDELEEARRELHALPLDSFVAARDDLAARLRAAGHRPAAAEVRKLRKPSVAAWAVNQLVHRHRDDIERLIRVSRELRSAQGAGADLGTVRKLSAQRHKAVASLTEEAGRLLGEEGLSSGRTQLERVTNTLLALTTDERGEGRLAAGTLERDEALAGFAGSFAPVEEEARPEDAERAAAERARREAERLAGLALRAEADATRLEKAALEAEEDAARARAAADAARDHARRARQEADAAAEATS